LPALHAAHTRVLPNNDDDVGQGVDEMKRSDNPMASFFEAQMTGTTDIMRATLDGMQRLQEITLRALREGAGGQMTLARSLTDARDPADLSRAQKELTGPVAEQAGRFQQELLQAITEMNGEVIRASYSMMERLSGAMAESSAAAGVQLPAGGAGGTAGMQSPLAMYEAGLKQWQNAVQQMSQTMMPGGPSQVADDQDEDDDGGGTATRSKAANKRKSGRR
jgi:hypothetical protein